jgi:hypothetical protein
MSFALTPASMSQPGDLLSVEECLKILQRWQTEGLTEEEHDELVEKAAAQFADKAQVAKFENDISEAAKMAKEIDDVFVEQEIIFLKLSLWFGIFALPLLIEWRGLKQVSVVILCS